MRNRKSFKTMLINVLSASLALAALTTTSTIAAASEMEEAEGKLRATFQNFQFQSMKPSEIPGLIEIFTGNQIIYYSREADILVFGQLFSSDGKSITEEKLKTYRNEKAEGIDTSKAVVVGRGPREIVFITNPECGYCKKAISWLATQDLSEVTIKFIFMIDRTNPITMAKAMGAICGKDKLKGILEAHSKALSTKEPVACEGGAETLANHAKVAEEVGAFATPYFVSGGQAWAGFDQARLAAILNAHGE